MLSFNRAQVTNYYVWFAFLFVQSVENKLCRCNKCDRNYHVSADGLKLALSVGNEDTSFYMKVILTFQ